MVTAPIAVGTQRSRVLSLDYLRGLMALSVMIYHYTVWSGVPLETDSFLRKLGIYAVSVFYILSGLSLAIVYGSRIASRSHVFAFWIRRFFRIGPLYWLAVTSVIAFAAVQSLATGSAFEFDIGRILLNYSLAFGFVSPTAYLSTGAWSIGNEIVFYAIFPLILLFSGSRNATILLVLAVSISVGAIFAFGKLDSSQSLVSQWGTYINPFNQFFLFWSGVGIGIFFRQMRDDKPHSRWVGHALTVAIVLLIVGFWTYPVVGDPIRLVTGPARLLLSGICVALVIACYIHPANARLPDIRIFSFLGEGCYSIYLLHPIIGGVLEFAMVRVAGLPAWLAYLVAFLVTLLASWWAFRFLEKPMMRHGSQIANRISARV